MRKLTLLTQINMVNFKDEWIFPTEWKVFGPEFKSRALAKGLTVLPQKYPDDILPDTIIGSLLGNTHLSVSMCNMFS